MKMGEIVKFHGTNRMDVEVLHEYGIQFTRRKFLGIFGEEEKDCWLLSDITFVTYDYPTWYKSGMIKIGIKLGDGYEIEFPKRRLQEARDFCLYVNQFKGGLQVAEDPDDLTVNVRVTLDDI